MPACHLSWDTLGVPGLFVLSTFPMSDDKNAYATGFVADHRSPIDERWGGWYVTGKPGPLRHIGNVPVISTAARTAQAPGDRPCSTSVAGQVRRHDVSVAVQRRRGARWCSSIRRT